MTGEKLKTYTKERGIRAKYMADEMGITPQALYLKLRDISRITLEDALKLKKICRMTDAEFKDIFGSEEWFWVMRNANN